MFSVLKVASGCTGDADEKVFLDPNAMSDDGTVAIRGYSFSEDDRYFAYGTSAKGSDWVTIRVCVSFHHNMAAVCVMFVFVIVKVRDCESKQDLDDVIERVKFSCMAWTHDHKGFFYNVRKSWTCLLSVRSADVFFAGVPEDGRQAGRD